METKPLTILAFFAHPDDEVMLGGGTLALLAKAGAHVHYLCATRGEGGENGEPPICSREQLGEVREKETVCAVQALGAKSLTFLNYIDPTVGEGDELYPFTDDLTMLTAQVTNSIKQFNADVLITHGADGEYGHPAHVVCHQAGLAAVLALEEDAPLMYTPLASYPEHPRQHMLNKCEPADYILDIHPVLEIKTAATLCHKTQHALFVRHTSQKLGRQVTVPEIVLQEESLRRTYPRDMEHDPVYELLKPGGTIRLYKEKK